MKLKFLILLTVLSVGNLLSQEIKSPSEYLGYEIGSRFTRHHQVVDYFKYISEASNLITLEKYGETNEFRPLLLAYISSEENLENLESIRKQNLDQTLGKSIGEKAIVWLSYNVHGNEASSTEAAMLTIYELITKKKDWLENTVIIMDPCINPDGRDRYVNWYNQVKSTPYDIEQNVKEHNEPWPGGRPNHYLFDLNRDWAWATQVETQQRLKVYNKWLPHIHVDFHEQGINSPYYFAPAAEPMHEIITDWQRDFQTAIGKNHAKYFDKEGWLYFTKERFDLLYPSYGDTYPTFMGAIGMTYEQAGHGRAGLGIKTDEGEVLTLKDRALHHMTTGLSTIEISSKNAETLNKEFKKFFDNSNMEYKSYVLKNDNQDKIDNVVNLLKKHEIKYGFAENNTVKGLLYSSQKEAKISVNETDLVIHTNQPKGKMVKALFEPKAMIADSLTYDITAWSIPYAHGIEAIASKTKVETIKAKGKMMIKNVMNKNAYAYIAKWNSMNDAAFLADLLQNNIVPRQSLNPFTSNGIGFERGSLVILRNDNRSSDFDNKLVDIANKHSRQVIAVPSGFSDSGSDFGSYTYRPINKQKIAVLSGQGTSSLSFGEIWHFFETQLKYPLHVLDTDYFSSVNLDSFDVLIMPEGYYGRILTSATLSKLNSFARNGGTVIAIGSALNAIAGKKGFSLKRKETDQDRTEPNLTPFAEQERSRAADLIAGAIFKSKVDNTHPLAFGYDTSYYTLKRSSAVYEYLPNGNVAYLDDNATSISGFAGKNVLEKVPETLIFGEERKGRGSFVYMVDNPLFRSFWDNGKLLFTNAVFLLNSDTLK